MLFVTNRRIDGSRRSEAGRSIIFAKGDPEPGASLYFCQRLGAEHYVELTAAPFFSRLRRSPWKTANSCCCCPAKCAWTARPTAMTD